MHYERFTPEDIAEALVSLKSGKSPGLDNIYGEHLKHAHFKLNYILSIIFNCMIIHGYLPLSVMDTIIVPLVKDKKGDLGSVDNYRPIAITCIVSKVLEIIILKRYEDHFLTSSNQFGFKANHGTEKCIFVLKQVIDFYKSKSSPVYLCFLDLSKAFDRVNHCILLDKLLERKLPVIIVRILQVWYATQHFVIQWGNSLSAPFNVTNGVRQGGILSPILFNVFIDELSEQLQGKTFGFHVNSECFNHIIYADDTVLLAPSPAALQKLIDVCNTYVSSHDLVFNVAKSKCLVVKPHSMKSLHVPTLRLDGKTINFVKKELYLGYTITDDFQDDEAILKEMRGLYARGNMIVKNFKFCSSEVKAKLFSTYCTAFYCCSMWSSFKTASLKRLHIAHNNIFRFLFTIGKRESVSVIFVKNNIPNMTIIRRKIVFSLYKHEL